MSAPLYQVVDWSRRYENFRSRQVDRCTFVCVPTKQGPVESVIRSTYNGAAIRGIWLDILCLCASQSLPREGYLTSDGTRDGWRLSDEELGHLWKTPAATVRHALEILTSPQVRLVEIVEGSIATPIPQVTSENDTASNVRERYSKYRDPDTPGIASGVDERRNEGKKERIPPVVPQGGDHTRPHQVFEEAKAWVNSLFTPRRKMAWSYEEERLLAALLPIDQEFRALLSWAYSLPRDDEGWALFGDQQLNKPKTNCIRFLREFGSEVEKWRSARAASNGPPEEEYDDGWTPERIAYRGEILPDKQFWPERFDQLPVSVRRQFNEVVAQKKEKNA